MQHADAIDAYKQAAVENAPPLKIVRMLFQGALRFLDQAARIDPKAAPGEFNDRLMRVDDILTELRCSLDHAAAPDLARRLDSVYEFAQHRLQTALATRTVAPLGDARKVLVTVLDGWTAIDLRGEDGR